MLSSPTDRFLGTYGFVAFEGSEMTAYGLPRTVAGSRWGRLSADGQGMWMTEEVFSNAEGLVTPGIIFGTGAPYTLDDLHGLSRNTNDAGALDADGGVGSSIRFTPPGIHLMCKPGGTLAPGDYGLFLFQFDTPVAPPGGDAAAWGTITLQPGGIAAVPTFDVNSNGSIIGGAMGSSGTYSSTPDGRALIDLGGIELTGTVGRAGRFVIFGGTSTDGRNLQIVMVLVRLSTGAGDALFSGEYDGVYIRGPNSVGGTPGWTVWRRSVLADGAGSFQERFSVGSRDGRYVPGGTSFGSPEAYTVAPDGKIALPLERGALSSDGRLLVLAGNVNSGSGPSFAFLAR